MRKLFFIISLLFCINYYEAQNLDSLFTEFVRIRNGSEFTENTLAFNPNNIEHKCGLGITAAINNNFDKFTPEQQRVLKVLLARPQTQKSIVTPSGKFRIHFDTTGIHAPGYDINELAAGADSVYAYQVLQLGFPPALSDGSAGGDSLYDFYIQNLGSSLYGYTQFEDKVTSNTWTTFTVIDNDFSNYFTTGINAAKVTLAHEYHHAIQISDYIYRDADLFYYEITSTSMEEFTFDYVNDYYGYMASYFRNPEITFALSPGGGYDLAIWNIFLNDRFPPANPDENIIKRIWGLMVDNRALTAISTAIEEEGHSFHYELNKFGLWTYFTGSRKIEGKYFEEAANYPLIKPVATIEFSPPGKEVTISSEPVSNNFLVFPDYTQGFADTLVSIITNGDVNGGISSLQNTLDFTYYLYSQQEAGANQINERYYSKLESDFLDMLRETTIFNNVPTSEGDFEREEIDFCFPQPFNYTTHSVINLPVVPDILGEANLFIFTSSMDLIYSGKHNIINGEKVVVKWNARDSNGEKLASGIYLYVTEVRDKIKKGKFVIYNE